MRVCGYFPNSHFFNIIERKAIDDWNDNILSERGKKDYYVMKDISFINSKIYLERVDSNNAPELIHLTKPRITEVDGLIDSYTNARRKIDISKKNRVEKRIDETKTVDETFDYNG